MCSDSHLRFVDDSDKYSHNHQEVSWYHRAPYLTKKIIERMVLKWLCVILAHSQNPQQPATLAETYLQISIMVTDIQNISHFLWTQQSFAFFISGAVSVPIFGRPLDLWLQDLWSHYRVYLPQTTSNILGDVILRLDLNSCDAGTICLQVDKYILSQVCV